jgi:3-phenylpropionate/cinnamic acid dioxygenase small subunit
MRAEIIHEVEQFLYREARLLDERRLHEWVELFTEDVRYWMPVSSNRYLAISKAIGSLDQGQSPETALVQQEELALLDETKASLRARIARLDTGMAWAEDPPSRTRHMISNVEVEEGDTASELKVYSNYLVYRTRGETEQDFYIGRREDVLRQVNSAWRIARRKIILDQNVLLAKNISIFF